MFDACRSYLVLAPKAVRRGADFTVSVSILQASRDVQVAGELKDSNDALLVYNSTTVAPGEQCILCSRLYYLHFFVLF